MNKSVFTFVVLALIGIGASNQAFAEANGNCITKPWQCKGWGVGNGGYKRNESAAGTAKVSGRPIDNLSKPHERHGQPLPRTDGCDRNMGGCINQ